uniref:Uncharacterized protein n=1 Tax=Trypanosoma vivax (strain Y486) TaxID=1055687 RepID=G0U1C0_TRYVY|nr:hypothetical protein, unlikely [Trypanosoma vivax Y486]
MVMVAAMPVRQQAHIACKSGPSIELRAVGVARRRVTHWASNTKSDGHTKQKCSSPSSARLSDHINSCRSCCFYPTKQRTGTSFARCLTRPPEIHECTRVHMNIS